DLVDEGPARCRAGERHQPHRLGGLDDVACYELFTRVLVNPVPQKTIRRAEPFDNARVQAVHAVEANPPLVATLHPPIRIAAFPLMNRKPRRHCRNPAIPAPLVPCLAPYLSLHPRGGRKGRPYLTRRSPEGAGSPSTSTTLSE